MEICLIWAEAYGGAIGKQNTLPWNVPEDLQHFKKTTGTHPVIMGRNTFFSLPKALPQRLNLVVSNNEDYTQEILRKGALTVSSLETAIRICHETGSPRAFVIGGAVLFKSAMPMADRLFVTRLSLEVPEADAFAPPIPDGFKLIKTEAFMSRTGVAFTIDEYVRQR